MKPHPPRLFFRIRMLGTSLATAAMAFAATATAPVDEVEQVRDNLRQALAYRDQAAKETNAWRQQQAEVANLLAVAVEEQRRLDEDLAASRQTLDDLDRRRRELAARDAVRTRFLALMAGRMPALAAELVRQHARWPAMLQAQTRRQIDLLAANKSVATLAEARRALEAAVTVLEEAGMFQSRINRASVMHRLPDGREALFDVIHFGLGTGYYHSADLKLAGTIEFDGEQWVWTEDNTLFEPLVQFSTILAGRAPATWVALPTPPRPDP